MASVLFRTASGPINSSPLPGSPRFSGPLRHGSLSACEKLEFSPLLHFNVSNNRRRLNRAISEPQAIIRLRSINAGSHTLPEILPEEEEESFDRISWFSASGIAVEEPEFPGVGSGSGRDRDGFGSGQCSGGSNNNNNSNSKGNSNSNDTSKIGAHYQKMLKSNPNDPLLLRNYSKFLHEVEGDTVKAEEYYGRAILANPGDGELLSLYGKLIWETQRDGERAKSYFDQALVASPDDCMVMGSYAQFMWEAEEDEDDDEEDYGSKVLAPAVQPLIAAF